MLWLKLNHVSERGPCRSPDLELVMKMNAILDAVVNTCSLQTIMITNTLHSDKWMNMHALDYFVVIMPPIGSLSWVYRKFATRGHKLLHIFTKMSIEQSMSSRLAHTLNVRISKWQLHTAEPESKPLTQRLDLFIKLITEYHDFNYNFLVLCVPNIKMCFKFLAISCTQHFSTDISYYTRPLSTVNTL